MDQSAVTQRIASFVEDMILVQFQHIHFLFVARLVVDSRKSKMRMLSS